jgi:hypothetical protein
MLLPFSLLSVKDGQKAAFGPAMRTLTSLQLFGVGEMTTLTFEFHYIHGDVTTSLPQSFDGTTSLRGELVAELATGCRLSDLKGLAATVYQRAFNKIIWNTQVYAAHDGALISSPDDAQVTPGKYFVRIPPMPNFLAITVSSESNYERTVVDALNYKHKDPITLTVRVGSNEAPDDAAKTVADRVSKIWPPLRLTNGGDVQFPHAHPVPYQVKRVSAGCVDVELTLYSTREWAAVRKTPGAVLHRSGPCDVPRTEPTDADHPDVQRVVAFWPTEAPGFPITRQVGDVTFVRDPFVVPAQEHDNVEFKTINSASPASVVREHFSKYFDRWDVATSAELYLGYTDDGVLQGIHNIAPTDVGDAARRTTIPFPEGAVSVAIECYTLPPVNGTCTIYRVKPRKCCDDPQMCCDPTKQPLCVGCSITTKCENCDKAFVSVASEEVALEQLRPQHDKSCVVANLARAFSHDPDDELNEHCFLVVPHVLPGGQRVKTGELVVRATYWTLEMLDQHPRYAFKIRYHRTFAAARCDRLGNAGSIDDKLWAHAWLRGHAQQHLERAATWIEQVVPHDAALSIIVTQASERTPPKSDATQQSLYVRCTGKKLWEFVDRAYCGLPVVVVFHATEISSLGVPEKIQHYNRIGFSVFPVCVLGDCEIARELMRTDYIAFVPSLLALLRWCFSTLSEEQSLISGALDRGLRARMASLPVRKAVARPDRRLDSPSSSLLPVLRGEQQLDVDSAQDCVMATPVSAALTTALCKLLLQQRQGRLTVARQRLAGATSAILLAIRTVQEKHAINFLGDCNDEDSFLPSNLRDCPKPLVIHTRSVQLIRKLTTMPVNGIIAVFEGTAVPGSPTVAMSTSPPVDVFKQLCDHYARFFPSAHENLATLRIKAGESADSRFLPLLPLTITRGSYTSLQTIAEEYCCRVEIASNPHGAAEAAVALLFNCEQRACEQPLLDNWEKMHETLGCLIQIRPASQNTFTWQFVHRLIAFRVLKELSEKVWQVSPVGLAFDASKGRVRVTARQLKDWLTKVLYPPERRANLVLARSFSSQGAKYPFSSVLMAASEGDLDVACGIVDAIAKETGTTATPSLSLALQILKARLHMRMAQGAVETDVPTGLTKATEAVRTLYNCKPGSPDATYCRNAAHAWATKYVCLQRQGEDAALLKAKTEALEWYDACTTVQDYQGAKSRESLRRFQAFLQEGKPFPWVTVDLRADDDLQII